MNFNKVNFYFIQVLLLNIFIILCAFCLFASVSPKGKTFPLHDACSNLETPAAVVLDESALISSQYAI